MLAKARHYVPEADLKNIYHAIFSSHIQYGSQVWTSKLISVTDKRINTYSYAASSIIENSMLPRDILGRFILQLTFFHLPPNAAREFFLSTSYSVSMHFMR